MSKRSMHAHSANLPGFALVLAGALGPGLAIGAPAGQGVMQGFPPPAQLRVNQANAFQPPYLRWSMRHAREVSPTRGIGRAAVPLALAEGPPASPRSGGLEGRRAALDPGRLP